MRWTNSTNASSRLSARMPCSVMRVPSSRVTPFPDHIRRALGEAQVALVVIGPSWLKVTGDSKAGSGSRRIDDPSDWVRIEIEALLQRDGVPVIPLLLGGANVPKADDLPPSLRALSVRNAMQLRPYPDFEHSVRTVVETIAKLLRVTPRPFGPQADAATETPPQVASTRLSVTGRKFVGRQQELHLLDEAWGRSRKEDKINIVSFIGQGGEGKTAIVLNWYARRARHGWQGARRVFDWSFYSQGTSNQSSASADDFFTKAFEWFGQTGEVPKDPWAKGEKLAALIAAERTLFVLDGLEPLQQPPGAYGGEFKDPAMKALLRYLAMRNAGLCILTSRTEITDLKDFEHEDGSCLRHPLHALDTEAARHLLQSLGVKGPDKELDEAIVWFKGHAYDLNLLGNYLHQCTEDHDIRRWREIPLLPSDEQVHAKADSSGKKKVTVAACCTPTNAGWGTTARPWQFCACWACSTVPPDPTCSMNCVPNPPSPVSPTGWWRPAERRLVPHARPTRTTRTHHPGNTHPSRRDSGGGSGYQS